MKMGCTLQRLSTYVQWLCSHLPNLSVLTQNLPRIVILNYFWCDILAHKPTTHSVVYIDYPFTIVTSGSWGICVSNLKHSLHHIIAGSIAYVTISRNCLSASHDMGRNWPELPWY